MQEFRNRNKDKQILKYNNFNNYIKKLIKMVYFNILILQ
jgi:hypothetical protein